MDDIGFIFHFCISHDNSRQINGKESISMQNHCQTVRYHGNSYHKYGIKSSHIETESADDMRRYDTCKSSHCNTHKKFQNDNHSKRTEIFPFHNGQCDDRQHIGDRIIASALNLQKGRQISCQI